MLATTSPTPDNKPSRRTRSVTGKEYSRVVKIACGLLAAVTASFILLPPSIATAYPVPFLPTAPASAPAPAAAAAAAAAPAAEPAAAPAPAPGGAADLGRATTDLARVTACASEGEIPAKFDKRVVAR